MRDLVIDVSFYYIAVIINKQIKIACAAIRVQNILFHNFVYRYSLMKIKFSTFYSTTRDFTKNKCCSYINE